MHRLSVVYFVKAEVLVKLILFVIYPFAFLSLSGNQTKEIVELSKG